jgi:hypothetical protein
MRSHVRSLDTSTLEATYPWIDSVDRKVFLMGWDAGERWGLSTRDSAEHMLAGS